jgi:hypothetical protein
MRHRLGQRQQAQTQHQEEQQQLRQRQVHVQKAADQELQQEQTEAALQLHSSYGYCVCACAVLLSLLAVLAGHFEQLTSTQKKDVGQTKQVGSGFVTSVGWEQNGEGERHSAAAGHRLRARL